MKRPCGMRRRIPKLALHWSIHGGLASGESKLARRDGAWKSTGATVGNCSAVIGTV